MQKKYVFHFSFSAKPIIDKYSAHFKGRGLLLRSRNHGTYQRDRDLYRVSQKMYTKVFSLQTGWDFYKLL